MINLFLSSTGRDLWDYRDAVYQMVCRIRGFECIRMEDFGAMDSSPLDACLTAVAESDVFVGIVGHIHGSNPPDDTRSFTELEYEQAKTSNIPRLMFVVDDDFRTRAVLREPDEKHQRQAEFRHDVLKERIASNFESPGELALHVIEALANLFLLHKAATAVLGEDYLITIEGPAKTMTQQQRVERGRRLELTPNSGEFHVKSVAAVPASGGERIMFDFTTGQMPPLSVFSRDTGATYLAPSGNFVPAQRGEPRFEEIEPGITALLIEPASTNLVKNSAAPETQTVYLDADEYPFQLWVAGEGSATISVGDHANYATLAEQAVGAAVEGSPLEFAVVSPGSVLVEVNGDLARFQLEQSAFPTSFIPTKEAETTRVSDYVGLILPLVF